MENTRPAPFEGAKPYAQLLIFIGVLLISFFLLGIVSIILQQVGVLNLMKLQDAANYTDDTVVKDFRIFQLISDVLLFMLPTAVIAFLVSRRRFDYMQMNRTGGIRMLLLGIITIIAALPFINYMGQINAQVHLPEMLKKWEDEGDTIEVALFAHHTIKDLLLNLLVMAFAAAVSEEICFRAGMQKIMIKMTENKHVGIWITAIVFSAIHMQFSGFLPRMLLGAFLGYLFVWSGSIWVNIMAHFVFNGSQILVSYLQDEKATSGAVDKAFSATPEVGYVIVSTILVALLVLVMYKMAGRKTEEVKSISEL